MLRNDRQKRIHTSQIMSKKKFISILSPAKRLDTGVENISGISFQPIFLDESQKLINKLKKLKSKDIADLMKVSNKISDLNFERYAQWHLPFSKDNSDEAILTFKGDVYRGMAAETFSKDQLLFAQENIRILSGLYGVLKPLDLIQPYRLEMGTRFQTSPKVKNLYQYWGNKISSELDSELTSDGVIINLASNEYFKAIKPKTFNHRIINFHFHDFKNGEYKPITIYNKLARGYMNRFLVKNKITNFEDLKLFDLKNYTFNDPKSSENDWVFTREKVEL